MLPFLQREEILALCGDVTGRGKKSHGGQGPERLGRAAARWAAEGLPLEASQVWGLAVSAQEVAHHLLPGGLPCPKILPPVTPFDYFYLPLAEML